MLFYTIVFQINLNYYTTLNMKTTKILYKDLSQIKHYYANYIGYFRFFLLIEACVLNQFYPYFACFSVFLSLVLDYFDGILARKHNQCSLFGHIIDWIGDISGQAINFLWWGTVCPSMVPVLFLFFMIQLSTALFDTALTVTNNYPFISQKSASKLNKKVLTWTMLVNNVGYKNIGIGYWLMLLYSLWSLFGYLASLQGYYLFSIISWINLPFAIMYVWMELSYMMICLEQWGQLKKADCIQLVNIHNKKVDDAEEKLQINNRKPSCSKSDNSQTTNQSQKAKPQI